MYMYTYACDGVPCSTQFGKGLYFADVCSKSTNYCFATPSKNEGLALLCEVHTLLPPPSSFSLPSFLSSSPPPLPILSPLTSSYVVFLQVALGSCHELLTADYDADQLPDGKHSVKGLGRMAPDPSLQHTL